MGDDDNDVGSSYNSVLVDLKFNSKPLINVLTMMAEDYIKNAPRVVQTIEQHLNSVHPTLKLPILYLIDSIVKNVKKDYINLFTQNIVSTFCGVFDKADEKVKQQMFKLRLTWNDIFPQRKLYAIDVRCHQLDKNWRISSAPPNNASTIHLNSKFLSTVKPVPVSRTLSTSTDSELSRPIGVSVGGAKMEADMREKLLQKQKELLELQKKKIELELLEMQNRAKKAELESKRLEELESTLQQEKFLMNQAEMAKSKTNIAHQILSSVQPQPQPVPSTLTPPKISNTNKTMTMSTTERDPRRERKTPAAVEKLKISPKTKDSLSMSPNKDNKGKRSPLSKSRKEPKEKRESNFDARKSTVLKRNYRDIGHIARRSNQPPSKKPWPDPTIVDLFGKDDVDLRTGQRPMNQLQRDNDFNWTPDVSNILEMAAKLGFLPPANGTVKDEVDSALPEAKKEIQTVDVVFDSRKKEYMKERRQTLIDQLWLGVQCGSCGIRFPPDQALRYSKHLDWHFRCNRREKANSKKAQSRSLYYNLSDWIKFEEIEDLEERAASIFEMQVEAEGETKNPIAEERTVLASGHEGATCPQCGETFQPFYDEDKEEWRLKNALLDQVEGEESKVYHVVCHEDYLRSLVEERMEEEKSLIVDQTLKTEEKTEEVKMDEDDEDEVLILKEGKKEVVLMEIDVDDDEDGVGQVKPDAEVENNKEAVTGPHSKISDSILTLPFDKPVIIRHVPSPIVINDDDSSSNLLPGISFDDSTGGVFEVALNSGIRRSESPVSVEEKRVVYKSMEFDFPKIKIEPLDELPEESIPLPLVAEAVQQPPPVVVSEGPIDLTADDDEMDSVDVCDGPASQATRQMTSIDGNSQLEETTRTTWVAPPKIKINITALNVAKKSPEPDKEQSTSPKPPSDLNRESEPEPEIVFTEELKRLKPRLVGRKLTNYPPKRGNKEESGLCVIS